MGSYTDAQLAAFAQATGIEPASGEYLQRLEEMQRLAFEFIKTVELERCGVRDGDGHWYGSNPLYGIVGDLARIVSGGKVAVALGDEEVPF